MSQPVVPDHAVVRYLQRAEGRTEDTVEDPWRVGVDVDGVRASIAAIVAQGVENGAPGVTWGKVRFMLRGPVVTTVLTREQFYSTPRRIAMRENALRLHRRATA